MSLESLLPQAVKDRYEYHEWKGASAILATEFPDEWIDIIQVLEGFTLLRSEIEVPGGHKSKVASKIDAAFEARGWQETLFDTEIVIQTRVFGGRGGTRVIGTTRHQSPTHKVDCFKNGVGLEIEWNNKDPFYDRDLNNFRLLFELRALRVGVIITRSDELQQIFNSLARGKSYGNSTTHMSKLLPRLAGGAGGGCPVLVFGIKHATYRDDVGTPVPIPNATPNPPPDDEDADAG